MLPTLLGEKRDGPAHESLFWRYGAKVALRSGQWKIVQTKKDATWELYNLSSDIGEQNDLSAKHPEIVEKLVAMAAREEE